MDIGDERIGFEEHDDQPDPLVVLCDALSASLAETGFVKVADESTIDAVHVIGSIRPFPARDGLDAA